MELRNVKDELIVLKKKSFTIYIFLIVSNIFDISKIFDTIRKIYIVKDFFFNTISSSFTFLNSI